MPRDNPWMKSRNALGVLVLATALLGCSRDAEVAFAATVALPGDAAALIPADACVVARLGSLDALEAKAGELQRVFDLRGGRVDLSAAFSLVGIDPTQVQRTKPIVLALVAADPRPVGTLVVPIVDASKPPRSFLFGKPRINGAYAGYAMGGRSDVTGAPPALVNNMPGGDISVRVDVARIVAAYRGVLGEDADPDALVKLVQASGAEPQAIASALWMFEGLRGWLNSTSAVDVAIGVRSGKLSFQCRMDSVAAIAPSGCDLTELMRCLVPFGGPMVFACRTAWVRDLFESLTSEAFLRAVPEEAREEVKAEFVKSAGTIRYWGDGMAFAGSLFGDSGARIAGVFKVTDVEGFRRSYDASTAAEANQRVGVELKKEPPLEVDGVELDRFRWIADLGDVAVMQPSLVGGILPEGGLQFSYGCVRDKTVVMAIGDDEVAKQAVAAARASETDLPALVSALSDEQRRNLELFGYMDVRRLFQDAAAAVPSAGIRVNDGEPIGIWFRVNSDQRGYDAALRVDLAGIGALGKLLGR